MRKKLETPHYQFQEMITSCAFGQVKISTILQMTKVIMTKVIMINMIHVLIHSTTEQIFKALA